jgi:S1-C subfamily serine protease
MKYITPLSVVLLGLLVLWPSEKQEKYVDVIDKVMPTVVEIHVKGEVTIGTNTKTRAGLGSGVFVHPRGYILTCKHLFSDFTKIESISVVLYDGSVVSGDLVAQSKHDLAIVRVMFFDKVPYAKLAVPSRLKVGQEVIAIGSPIGLSFSVSKGVISGLYRDFPWAYNTIQMDAALNPGNSGGPLFNMQGELVGINSFFLGISPFVPVSSGLNFAIQVGQCLEFLVLSSKDLPEMRRFKWLRSLVF